MTLISVVTDSVRAIPSLAFVHVDNTVEIDRTNSCSKEVFVAWVQIGVLSMIRAVKVREESCWDFVDTEMRMMTKPHD